MRRRLWFVLGAGLVFACGLDLTGIPGTTSEGIDGSTSAEGGGGDVDARTQADGADIATGTPLPPPKGRVPGALALYTFEENAGAIVNDVSGIAPPLNLTIPGTGTSWIAGALVINASSLLTSAAAAKVIDACKA